MTNPFKNFNFKCNICGKSFQILCNEQKHQLFLCFLLKLSHIQHSRSSYSPLLFRKCLLRTYCLGLRYAYVEFLWCFQLVGTINQAKVQFPLRRHSNKLWNSDGLVWFRKIHIQCNGKTTSAFLARNLEVKQEKPPQFFQLSGTGNVGSGLLERTFSRGAQT